MFYFLFSPRKDLGYEEKAIESDLEVEVDTKLEPK